MNRAKRAKTKRLSAVRAGRKPVKERTFLCEMCKGPDIHLRYRAKGEQLDSSYHAPGWNIAPRALLRCYCRRCGYYWNENVGVHP